MKFKNYINEYMSMEFNDDIDKMWNLIYKNSRKYMKLLGTDYPLMRGGNYDGDMGISKVRQDRKASGRHLYAEEGYEYLNKWLESKGYPRRDRSVMATSDVQHAHKFSTGTVFYIFPIGTKWKFAYCKNIDFNFDSNVHKKLAQAGNLVYKSSNRWGIKEKDWDSHVKSIKQSTSEYLDDFISDKNFKEAHRRAYETWFNCKEFYYISASEYDLK